MVVAIELCVTEIHEPGIERSRRACAKFIVGFNLNTCRVGCGCRAVAVLMAVRWGFVLGTRHRLVSHSIVNGLLCMYILGTLAIYSGDASKSCWGDLRCTGRQTFLP